MSGFSAEIQGLDAMIRQFNAIGKGAAEQAVHETTKKAQAQAKLLAPVGGTGGAGELRESIHTKFSSTGSIFEGIVYTNKEYAPYVEFGTGPIGQKNKPELPEGISISYRQDAWWIHESQIDEEVANRYHFFRIETPAGLFYRCGGQAAQPFMVPAAALAKRIFPTEAEKAVKAWARR